MAGLLEMYFSFMQSGTYVVGGRKGPGRTLMKVKKISKGHGPFQNEPSGIHSPEPALFLSEIDLSAGQRHGFEHLLKPETWLLIRFFLGDRFTACVAIVGIAMLLFHNKSLQLKSYRFKRSCLKTD